MEQVPEHEAKAIRQYVNSQGDRADPVSTVQKVGARRFRHENFEFYDVRTEGGVRWWVITNPDNLYDQETYKTAEEAFTLHLGLRQQLFETSQRGLGDEEPDEVVPTPAWRRWRLAADAMNGAVEAEDFQAVGIKCREALLGLIRQHVGDEWVPQVAEPPQAANFKGWMEIYTEALLVNRRPRSYLKTLADKAWDLAVWLQHFRDAREWDAEMVLDATAHVINTLTLAIVTYNRSLPARCPRCDSYRLSCDGEEGMRKGLEGWWSQQLCAICGWRGERQFESEDDRWGGVGGKEAALDRYLGIDRGVGTDSKDEPGAG